jgi:hypothetical protein
MQALETSSTPGGELHAPARDLEPVAPGASVVVASFAPDPTFERMKPVRVDLADMVARGVRPETLVGMGVYCKGDRANPSGGGAITAVGRSEWYGLVVDVTLEGGQVWRAVQTREFLNGWFSLDGKLHGAPYLAQLAGTVASVKASASSAKEQADKSHAQALIDLAAQYPQLKRADTTHSGGKLAAVNMRALLKAAFKGVKFSVTSDYRSARVAWTDGPTDAQVQAVVGRFDIGASDTQSDYFYTVATAWSELFSGVQYLHTVREMSDAAINAILAAEWPEGDGDARPSLEDWRKSRGVFGWGNENYWTRERRQSAVAKWEGPSK